MAAMTEGSSPGTGRAAAIYLTKFLSLREKLTSKLTISPNKASPPPVLPISTPVSPRGHEQQQQPLEGNGLPPIIRMMREKELGRFIINLAVPVAAAVLISSDGTLLVGHVVVVGLMTGCMGIWNGILFRTTLPRIANVVEQVGISLVLLSIYGLVASFLPKGFSWILWLSGALCLLPLILAPILRETPEIPS